MAANELWHGGSWNIGGLKLPELGWTEWLGKTISGGKTTDLSNAITGQSNAQTPPPQTPPPSTPPMPTPSNVPVSTPQTTAPAPQKQASGNYGGGWDWGFMQQFYQNWPEAAAKADFQSAFGGDINRLMQARGYGGGGGQPDYSAQIDAIYNPAYQSLTERENYLNNTALPNLNSQTEAEVEKSLNDLNSQISGVKTDATTQQNQLWDQQRRALGDILRSYLALQQQGNAKFGRGSSTGAAISELTGQEYLRNQGNISTQYANETGKLADTVLKAELFATQKKSELDTWRKNQVQANNQRIQQELLAINSAKYQLDSDKAAKRFEALQEGVRRTQQIADMYKAQQMELETWKEKVAFQTQEDFKKLQAGFSSIGNIAAPQNQFVLPTGQTNASYTLPNLNYLNSQQKKTDEFGRLIQPQFTDYLG